MDNLQKYFYDLLPDYMPNEQAIEFAKHMAKKYTEKIDDDALYNLIDGMCEYGFLSNKIHLSDAYERIKDYLVHTNAEG